MKVNNHCLECNNDSKSTATAGCFINGTNLTDYVVNQSIMLNVQHNCDSSDDIKCIFNGEDNSVDARIFPSAHDTSIINATVTIKGENVAEEGLYTLACSVGSESSTYSTVITVTSGKFNVKKCFN